MRWVPVFEPGTGTQRTLSGDERSAQLPHSPAMSPDPVSMDPVETNPNHYRVVFENEKARVLEYTGGNQRRAALLLGIARRTLRQKLRDLGLHVTHSVEADEDDLP